MSKLGHKKDK